MFTWFDSLPLLEQIFFYIALPSTVIMLIQTVLLFFGGLDDVGLEADTSGLGLSDSSLDNGISADLDDLTEAVQGSGDLRFVTIRGIIAFFTVAGWTGITCLEMGLPGGLSAVLALIVGSAALIGVAYLIRALTRLQFHNVLDYRSALGQIAEVYLTIPAKGEGLGKVSMVLGGAYTQYDAVTNEFNLIRTGEVVRIIDVIRGNVMVVESESSEGN